MRDDEHGRAVLPVDLLKQYQNVSRCFRIQRSGRFITEQELRIFDQCPCDRAALLLSTGKLRRELVLMLGEPQCL